MKSPSSIFSSQYLLHWGLFLWLVLNLLQAAFTGLLHDEAYYWVFSTDLSIVYFDQMPGVAYFIRAGSLLFNNELGVRLLTVIVGPLVLLGIYKLAGVKDPKWLFALAFSVLSIHFIGFFTSPDAVLSFTLLLFLLAYKKFIDRPGLLNALLMGLAAAAVCYSKYQGILFILILCLVQFRLWKKPGFWLAVAVTIGLALPIYLADQNTVQESLRYHLTSRGSKEGSISDLGSFLFSQVIILGPFMTPVLIWGFIFYKPDTPFLKSLKWAVYIYFGLLVLLCFRTHVEANWSAPMIGCLLIFGVKYWSEKPTSWKWIRSVFIFSFVCIMVLRVYMVWNFLPDSLSQKLRPEIHGWKQLALDMRQICGNEPVVFSNSYQLPSKYWFYSGQPATCLSNCRYRRNQFNLMPMEKLWQGKPAWLVSGWEYTTHSKQVKTPSGGVLYLTRMDSLFSYYEIKISTSLPAGEMRSGDSTLIPVHVYSTEPTGRFYRAPEKGQVNIAYSWYTKVRPVVSGKDHYNLLGHHTTEVINRNIMLVFPKHPGNYVLYLYILGDHWLTENSGGIPVVIK
jgi:hypothetical protein